MSPSVHRDVVAVIPARGGSKGVPGKNLRRVGGVPLVARAVHAAHAAGVGAVYVSTDDAAIAAAARAAGADVIDRPVEISGDLASSESALLHSLDVLAARGRTPSVLVFLQATSPFIDSTALSAAVERVRAGDADSVFSAFETYAFLWRADEHGGASGVNHDASFRPRRQDRKAHWQETGAFYVMAVDGFRASGHRFFGRTAMQPVPEASAIEIDDLEQFEIASRLAPQFEDVRVVRALAVVTDFDGVHTDDTAIVGVDGVELVRVSRSDGLGVERLRNAGIPVLILSKERHPVVAARAAKLGVEVLHGVDDKASVLKRWCAESGIEPADVAYIGNDVNDAQCLEFVGWPVVPADANEEVRPLARVVLSKNGGRGAVRELAEMVLAGRKGTDDGA